MLKTVEMSLLNTEVNALSRILTYKVRFHWGKIIYIGSTSDLLNVRVQLFRTVII